MVDAYDPHELLGITPGSSEEEIRRAFRRKAKTVHPDVSDAPDAAEQFKRLNEAHDLLIERLSNPQAPTPEGIYRPAQPLSEEDQDTIIQSFRRRREAEQRRRSRRRNAVRGNARRAQRENTAFQEEMARRRAAYEADLRHAAQAEEETLERARRNRERLEREREAERARKEELEREREAEERAQRERERAERQERQATRQRAAREQAERQRREQERKLRPDERREHSRANANADGATRCAWKDCRVSQELAAPIPTALGLRRFCREHYDEYLAFRRSKEEEHESRRESVRG